MEGTSASFEYKANVKGKVKQIESRLTFDGIVEHEINHVSKNINKLQDGTKSTSVDIPILIATKKEYPAVLLKSYSIDSMKNTDIHTSGSEKEIRSGIHKTERKQLQQVSPVHLSHLSKQSQPPPIHSRSDVNKSTTTTSMDIREKQTPSKIPTPALRKLVHRQSLQNGNTEIVPAAEVDRVLHSLPITTTTLASTSGSSTRRSSEDDGIADMALESDPFDDSNMPLPKIKDNTFFQKDRSKSSDHGTVEELPSFSPRRASLIPQSAYDKSKQGHPKPSRTRTESTNSAENFVIRQFSADDDFGRRESQAEVKIDVLQSNPLKGSPQGSSPIRSPVIVRTNTISNSAASILVLGMPQSGKSSTIDALMQHRVTQRVHEKGPEIVEYTAKIKILDSTNPFNLKIIETPGYSNDPTMSSDARLLATLVPYLDSKSGLRGKPPTIVLIVLRFDDKRLWNPEDEHPDIVHFLKLIDNFQQQLNDGKYANFVFILTHFLSGSTTQQELRKPQTKIVELINLIQKYTSLPTPIMVVCAENHNPGRTKSTPENSTEFISDKNISGAVTLPNGETYPYNLIDKIKILLTKKGRDSVGETVLRTAFGIEYPYSIKECQVTQRIPLISHSHLSVQKMQTTIMHAYMDIQRTEIFTLLEIGWENVDIKIRQKYPDSLFAVQQIFQTKKVCKFDDIPEDSVKVLNLVRQMPSNLAVKDLLIDTLQLKVPACYPALYIGQGFDLSKDTTTNVSPFQFHTGLKTSPVGLIPNEFECKIRDDRELCFKFFYTVEEYVLERLKDMNLRYSVSPNSLSALSASATSAQRWGYNHVKKNQEPTKSTVATAVLEYRVFQLTLHQQPELKFKPQFWETIQEITDLDINDASSVSAWQEFFGYWGTHIVKSAFGGGSVEITFRGSALSKIYNSMRKDFILPSDEYETTRVFQWITGDGLDFVACGKDLKSDFLHGCDVESHFHGGDIRFQQMDLTKLTTKEMVSEIREEWKESLVQNPVMLDTNLVLVPISYYVRPIAEGIATKIDVALHYFYSDFMISQGKQSSCNLL